MYMPGHLHVGNARVVCITTHPPAVSLQSCSPAALSLSPPLAHRCHGPYADGTSKMRRRRLSAVWATLSRFAATTASNVVWAIGLRNPCW